MSKQTYALLKTTNLKVVEMKIEWFLASNLKKYNHSLWLGGYDQNQIKSAFPNNIKNPLTK